jgi:branched-subunit amino acid aminotransferase/4-amino-4-deoxychorismate lyase
MARMTLTRGEGKRGYSPVGAEQPLLAISLHEPPVGASELPPQWKLVCSSIRVPAGDRLARYKTLNKLPNILARMEADEQEADEALILNTRGEVTEGSASNLFWVEKGVIFTITTLGVVEVVMFEIHTLARSPLVRKLAEAYRALVEKECGV